MPDTATFTHPIRSFIFSCHTSSPSNPLFTDVIVNLVCPWAYLSCLILSSHQSDTLPLVPSPPQILQIIYLITFFFFFCKFLRHKSDNTGRPSIHCVVEDVTKFLTLLLLPSKSGITDVHHYAWLLPFRKHCVVSDDCSGPLKLSSELHHNPFWK